MHIFAVRFTLAYFFFLLDIHLTLFYETERIKFIFPSSVALCLDVTYLYNTIVYTYIEADQGRPYIYNVTYRQCNASCLHSQQYTNISMLAVKIFQN